jgi:hypothetical protein
MDVVLHPRFNENKLIYLSYTKPLDDKRRTLAVARGTWDGKAIKDMEGHLRGEGLSPRWRASPSIATTCSTSRPPRPDPATRRRSPKSQGGKVLRWPTMEACRRTIRSWGRKAICRSFSRSVTELAGLCPASANGRDVAQRERPQRRRRDQRAGRRKELRVADGELRPVVHGSVAVGDSRAAGFEPPIVYWVPAIAVSGMAFYTGDRLAKWKGDVFVGSLRTGEIPGTGHLERILFNEKMEELRRESLLTELHQRIRDVRQGPDGLLYVLTGCEARSCAAHRTARLQERNK